MKRCMIDIETLGTDPGAAIVSIGAVTFSIDEGVLDEFSVSVSLSDCQAHGLEIDAETLSWWLNQPPTAREQLHGGRDLESTLRELSDFVDGCDEVWANSPAFDCVILREAFDAVGLRPPWRYYAERDYRTVRELVGDWPEDSQDGTEHDALDDARHQAECLIEAFAEHGGLR